MVETVRFYYEPHCDLDLEDSKPIFSHDILAHNDAPPYPGWLQKVQQLRKHVPDETAMKS